MDVVFVKLLYRIVACVRASKDRIGNAYLCIKRLNANENVSYSRVIGRWIRCSVDV